MHFSAPSPDIEFYFRTVLQAFYKLRCAKLFARCFLVVLSSYLPTSGFVATPRRCPYVNYIHFRTSSTCVRRRIPRITASTRPYEYEYSNKSALTSFWRC
eukprot:scaffold255156_cov19-Prasinocladus_malaysianus.AAC.1